MIQFLFHEQKVNNKSKKNNQKLFTMYYSRVLETVHILTRKIAKI